ncbi:MAG: restriction endonuclease subunit S [candidate division WOR-3 bacterium]
MKMFEEFNKTQKKPWEVEGVEWKEVRLGEISHIESGSRPKGGVKKYTGGIPSIGGEHLNYDGNFSFENLRYIPESFYEQSNKGKIKKFDILIVKDGATTGKTAFVGDDFPFEKAMVNEHVFLCRIIDGRIYPKFVFRFLMSKEGQNRILKTKGGTAQGGINKRFSKLVKIPLPFRNGKPDLETQKKIVEYIEANFSIIDKILEKKKRELQKLDELWESVLEKAFKPKEGEEWREVRLGEVIVEKPKYGLTAKANDKGKFVFFRISDIDDRGEIKSDNFKFVDLDISEKAKYEIRKGDLLLARSGSVGNFFIAFKDYPNWVYASYLIRFRLDLNKVDLMFVKHFLSSQSFKKWVSYQKRPGAQPNINAKEYSSLKIPLPFRNGKPDIEKQKEIAQYLDGIYEKIKTLKEKIQNQINQLKELKESILDEVFSINTPQTPKMM